MPSEGTEKVRHSPANERALLSYAMRSSEARDVLVRELPQDAFVFLPHATIWSALKECHRRGLEPTDAILENVSSGLVDLRYAAEVAQETHPAENLQRHLAIQKWDVVRLRAMTGPMSALIEEARKVDADPGRCRALAEQLVVSLRGGEERKWMRSTAGLVSEIQARLTERKDGIAVWPFGIPGFDKYEEGHEKEGRWRCIPGAKPGKVTTLTALSGCGKSTVAGRMALGLSSHRRRVLYGAWEPDPADVLELASAMSLGLDRGDVSEGAIEVSVLNDLVARASAVGRGIKFVENPFFSDDFRRTVGNDRRSDYSNDRNLDILAGYISDSGADVFIADLWERMLVEPDDPKGVTRALFRTQRIASQLKVHFVLLAQQLLKGEDGAESRADHRPTRRGIQGSSRWVQVSDLIIGVHQPALFKTVANKTIELILLKQRDGIWPQVVEYDWDPGKSEFSKPRTIPYDDPTLGGRQVDGPADAFLGNPGRGRDRKSKRGPIKGGDDAGPPED